MKAVTILLVGEQQRQRALDVIKAIPLEPLVEVVVREKRTNRSLAQNALLWKWNTAIADDKGHTPEEVHDEMKLKLLPAILLANPDDYEGYAETFAAVRATMNTPQYPQIRKLLASKLETKTLKVHHMSEYLNALDAAALGMGIVLEHPEDMYREAMG